MSVYLPDNRITAPELWYPGRKPTVPVRLIENSITRCFACYYLFSEMTGLPIDLTSSLVATPIGTAETLWVSGLGYRTEVDGLLLGAKQPELGLDDYYCWFIDFVFNYSVEPYHVIYGNRFDSSQYIKLTIDKVEIISSNNSISYPAFQAGKRYSVFLTKQANTFSLYINGESVGSRTLNEILPENYVFIGGSRLIGGHQSTDVTVISAFHGKIPATKSLPKALHLNPYQFLEAA